MGEGVVLPWVDVHCVIYETSFVCNGSQEISVEMEEGVQSICHRYMFIVAIYKTYLEYWFSRNICLI